MFVFIILRFFNLSKMLKKFEDRILSGLGVFVSGVKVGLKIFIFIDRYIFLFFKFFIILLILYYLLIK